jgi:hypothetical protein
VEDWFAGTRDVVEDDPTAPSKWQNLKKPEIPTLGTYEQILPSEFWKSFPSHYPTNIKKTVNIELLKRYIAKCWKNWTLPQKCTASRAVAFLEAKIPAPLTTDLPGIQEKNAPSTTENRDIMTYVLATWVKKGFVAGPFENPPFENFHENPLMATVQKTKVRPVRYHCGGWSEEVNSCILISYMVYL